MWPFGWGATRFWLPTSSRFPFPLQAPKKAKRRQGGGDGGSSNVFSMFEQSQIQEYKEVRFTTPTVMLHHLEPRVHKHHLGYTSNTSDPRPALPGDLRVRLFGPFSEQLLFPVPRFSHDYSPSGGTSLGGAQAFLTPSEASRVLPSSDLPQSSPGGRRNKCWGRRPMKDL